MVAHYPTRQKNSKICCLFNEQYFVHLCICFLIEAYKLILKTFYDSFLQRNLFLVFNCVLFWGIPFILLAFVLYLSFFVEKRLRTPFLTFNSIEEEEVEATLTLESIL